MNNNGAESQFPGQGIILPELENIFSNLQYLKALANWQPPSSDLRIYDNW